MKKIFTLILCTMLLKQAWSQSIAINNDGSQPNTSAMLDIKNPNKGLLIPRVNLASDSDHITIPSPLPSLLVFNINTALPEGAGFYYWNINNKWTKLATVSGSANTPWSIVGNNIDDPDDDFIGTTNNKALSFKTNNIPSGRIAHNISGAFFGQHAGENDFVGINNSFFGHDAGATNTIGEANTAVGARALHSNVYGNRNVAIGYNTLSSNENGDRNVALGNSALAKLVGGDDNVASGFQAMYSNVYGQKNIALGSYALYANEIGVNNVAIGDSALFKNTRHFNIAVGGKALFSNIDGSYNIAMGYRTLYYNKGSDNIAFGGYTAESNTTGNNNVSIGNAAMSTNTVGHDNVAIGSGAMAKTIPGSPITSGTYNIAIGASATLTSGNLSNATAMGYKAQVSASNSMSLGGTDVLTWGFGRSSVSPALTLQVGTHNLNGNGASLTNGGTWTNASSRTKKNDFTNVNTTSLLEKIKQMLIQKWKYIGTNEYHIGPVAEDFYAAFGLGTDDQGISTVDPSGIALAGMKELILINEKQNKLIEQLRERIEMLEKK